MRTIRVFAVLVCIVSPNLTSVRGADSSPASYPRIQAHLDGIPAIDTHDHLWKFNELPDLREAADGKRVMNLSSVWQNSYLNWFNVLPAWQPRTDFNHRRADRRAEQPHHCKPP